jgi:hypothetical protein
MNWSVNFKLNSMIIVHEIVLKVITYEFVYYIYVICLPTIVTF